MKRVDLYITLLQFDSLKTISQKTGLTFSEHIRRAIDSYIKEQQKHDTLQQIK